MIKTGSFLKKEIETCYQMTKKNCCQSIDYLCLIHFLAQILFRLLVPVTVVRATIAALVNVIGLWLSLPPQVQLRTACEVEAKKTYWIIDP